MNSDEIVVLVHHRGKWLYYSAIPDDWILDIPAYRESFIRGGHSVPELDENDRFGIHVLNEETVDTFLEKLDSLNEADLKARLASMSPTDDWFDVDYLFPKLLVDFDRKRLVDLYTEGYPLADYVPPGWVGEYGDFYEEIPNSHRYWIDGDIDHLEELKKRWESTHKK